MTSLQVIDYAGQRVLTTNQLAESFGTDSRRISENFNANKNRYSESKHFFLVEGDELKHFGEQYGNTVSVTRVSRMYLWTEKGAWMHAKSLNTDRAWDAYEMLVDDYYSAKDHTPQIMDKDTAIAIALHKTADLMMKFPEIESRLERVENNTTVEHSQMLSIKIAASKAVTAALGGRKSEAFQNKGLRSRAYQELWRDYKDYFEINSYHNTLKKDFDKALSHIKTWNPTGGLLREIESTNRQMAF